MSDKWFHIAITWDGVAGAVQFYQNGKRMPDSVCSQAATGDAASLQFKMPQPGKLVMFHEQDTFGGGFDANHNVNGGIDELRWWSTVGRSSIAL